MRFAMLSILAGCLVALAAAQEPKPATDPDRKLEQLIEQLGSSKFRIREAAAKELLALGKRAIPALRKAQRSTDPDVRLRAQLLLNEIGSGVPNLIEELSDKDPKVRQAAAHKLELLGEKAASAVPVLVKALKDSNPEVREAATAALSAIDPNNNKALAGADHPRASVKGKYRKLLRKIKVEQDKQSYGEFHEWGHYTGDSWAGHNNLPPGYWVYVYPHWYIWGELRAK